MQTVVVSERLSLKLYNSIEKFPVENDLSARQYATAISSLASNDEELAHMQERVDLFSRMNKPAEAAREEANIRLSKSLIESGYDPKSLEFACFVHSVNGKPVTSIDEDDLTALIAKLRKDGLTDELIYSSLESAKKEMELEIRMYFPARLAKGRKMNNLVKYKAYGVALADYYQNPTDEAKLELDKATLAVALIQDVYTFGIDNNVTAVMKTAQQGTYNILMECGVVDPESMSVFQYYSWIDTLEKRYEEQKQSLAKSQKHAGK
ncbi:hypothetical protein GCM10028805_22490 [Spirosoma harenae]